MTPFHREIDLRLQFQIALIIQGIVSIQTRIGAQFVETDQVIAGNLGGGETGSHTALEIAGSGGALGKCAERYCKQQKQNDKRFFHN